MPVTSDPGIALSALHDHLGYWMRLVSNAVSHGFARSIEGQGVTVAEWVLLRMLFDQESAAPSHLAKQMGMTKGAISKLSDRLLDKHLIARAADTADRRAHRLALTAAGRALVPKLAALADENDSRFFKALGPEDQVRLGNLLRAMAEAHGLRNTPLS